jgi:hypothetical protein
MAAGMLSPVTLPNPRRAIRALGEDTTTSNYAYEKRRRKVTARPTERLPVEGKEVKAHALMFSRFSKLS